MDNKAILIIDMVNDFVLDEAPLCVAGAKSTIPSISRFIDFGRQNRWNIVYINRLHHPSGIDAEISRKHLFTSGKAFCVPGTFGAEVVKELTPEKEDLVFNKTRFSAFYGTNLDNVLRRLKIKQIFITGTQYPNCIRASAVDAMALDYETIICTDCCSAANSEIAEANIRDLKNMGICCIPSSEIIKNTVI